MPLLRRVLSDLIMNKTHQPPKTLTIRFCPKCGRDNRWTDVHDKHYAQGRLCEGKLITVTYHVEARGE
jgi:hypothetical protein